MSEYELLRAEILEQLNGIRAYEGGMYTVVVAILAFTVNSKYYLASMLPYLVIISVFFVVAPKRYAIVRAGTYLNVFHEGSNYNWERRLSRFGRELTGAKDSFLRWSDYAPYYLLAFSCSIVSTLKLFANGKFSVCYKSGISLGIVIFTIIVFFVFNRNAIDYLKEKESMIKIWNTIQVYEKNTQENSIDGSNPSVEVSRKDDTVMTQTLMELVLLVLENSENKEEATESIQKLSIFNRIEE